MSFTNIVTNGFGRHSIFTDGQFTGSISASPFANMTDIRDSFGQFSGQDRVDGFGNTQHFDENFVNTGFSRPNLQGGYDSYSQDGLFSQTHDTATGFNIQDSEGHFGSVFGDIDASDDVVDSLLNHFK